MGNTSSITAYAIIIPVHCHTEYAKFSLGLSITSRRHQNVLRTVEGRVFMVDNEDSIEERVAEKVSD